MRDTFLVKNPGMLTTVQDMGRLGLGKFGIPVSGVMDWFSYRTANLLVGNKATDAVLEITLTGLTLKVLRPVKASITGGDMGPVIDGKPVPMWRTIILSPGETIFLKTVHRGVRSYLAVEGGFAVPKILNSRSTHSLALFGSPLAKDEILKTMLPDSLTPLRYVPEECIPSYPKEISVRVILGPQDNYFTRRGIKTFLSKSYIINNNSTRHAYRTQGPVVEHLTGTDIISDAILPGSIQIPGDGQPIIMMADAQTTGGYPKIACVISPDIDTLSQVLPGQRIRFKSVSIEKAHEIHVSYRNKVASLAADMINEYVLSQFC